MQLSRTYELLLGAAQGGGSADRLTQVTLSHKCVTKSTFQLEVRFSIYFMSLPVDTILGVAGVGVGLPGLVQVSVGSCELSSYWMLT